MGRLFYGNFDVEYDLAGLQRSPKAVRRRLNAELLPAWVGIADENDAIASMDTFDSEWPSLLAAAGLPDVAILPTSDHRTASRELCPWGWSAATVEWGTKRNCAVDAPPLRSVQTANSRVFSLGLEREWNVGLPGAGIVRSLEEAKTALVDLPVDCERWVLKAEFGMSGRERLLGRGRHLTEAAANWVESRVGRGNALILEPWVDLVDEVGLQFTVPKAGDVVLEGVTGLLTDNAGGYRGSRFDVAAECRDHWRTAIDVARRAAEQVRALGYFGPLGIDAIEYRDGNGNPRFRPLQDVNVRFTMGRLALGFRRLLKPGEAGLWLHQRWPTADVESNRRHFEEWCATVPASLRVVRTSPFTIGGRPVGHGTVVLIGPAREFPGYDPTSRLKAAGQSGVDPPVL